MVMGRIVVTAFVTVDGVVQAPGFQDEDRDGGFELGGWTQPFGDAEVEARVVASVLAADALLLGRRSYELLSSFWPTADPTDVRTAKLNSQPKYVASRTLDTVGWNATLLRGDLLAEVTALKEAHEEISIWGSSGLLTDLLAADLVDEFVLLIYPVVLGSGKRLFPTGQSHGLALVSSEVSSKGVVIQVYRRAELPRKDEEWVG
jgi:dihydrofolate reductase